MEKFYLSWQDIHLYIRTLSENLKEYGPLYITGIPRGGLIPAAMLSHSMEKEFLNLHEAIEMDDITRRRIVLVDDISDSGTTLLKYSKYNFITSSLITRYNTYYTPTITAKEWNDDKWIVFPWENRKAKPLPGYLEFTD